MPMKRTRLLSALTLGTGPLASGAWAQDSISCAGSGGGLAQVMKAVYDDPFTAETGITVNALARTDRVLAIKAMMAAGKTTWDVSELNPIDYASASLQGWQ